jgi:hypothetical protein
MISLSTIVHRAPDLSIGYFVQEGVLFNAEDFAETYCLNVHDIDHDDVKAATDASARLRDGEWLEVSFNYWSENSED